MKSTSPQKMGKKITSVALVLCMLLVLIPQVALAYTTPTFTIGSGTVAPGGTVEVAISLSDNEDSDLMENNFNVTFDSDNLTLQSVEPGSLLSGISTVDGGGVNLLCNDSDGVFDLIEIVSDSYEDPISGNGEYLILTFAADANATEKDYTIGVTEASDGAAYFTFGSDFEEVRVAPTVNVGTITVDASYTGDTPAAEPSLSITADKTTPYAPGDTATFTVALNNCDYTYDFFAVKFETTTGLTYSSYQIGSNYSSWSTTTLGTPVNYVESMGEVGISANGTLFTVSFVVDSDAADDDYTFSVVESDSFIGATDGTAGPTILSGSCTINVNASSTPAADATYTGSSYSASGSAGYGGTIAVDSTSGAFTATATVSGYVIDEIFVDGVSLSASDVQGESAYTYTFDASATGTHSIVATFAYTVNFLNPANGTLSVSRGGAPLTSGAIVRAGDQLVITVTPNTSYEISDLKVNGVDVTSQVVSGKYTYTVGTLGAYRTLADGRRVGTQGAVITAATTSAVVAQAPVITTQPTDQTYLVGDTTQPFTVGATSPDGGTLTYQWYRAYVSSEPSSTAAFTAISGATEASWTQYSGSPQVLGVKDNGYLYCAVTNTLGTSTATAVSDFVRFYVGPKPLSVSVADGIEHGTVKALTSSVYQGDYAVVSAVPDSGYALSSLQYTTDGTAYTDISGYAFTMPSGDVTITATFTAVTPDLTITTPADFKTFADAVNAGNDYSGKVVALGADIDLSGYPNWTPIGSSSSPFCGTFDGCGYTVQNMTVTSGTPGEDLGLFGYIQNATVRNLSVTGSVTARAEYRSNGTSYLWYCDYAAGIVGTANDSTIENCSNYASVSGPGYSLAGVVANFSGTSDGSVIGCSNYASITGAQAVDETATSETWAQYLGGVIGRNGSFGALSVICCANNGDVSLDLSADVAATGTIMSGIGGNNATTVVGCYNTGNLTGDVFSLGGIANYCKSLISDCYNTGTVSNTFPTASPGNNNDPLTGGISGTSFSTAKMSNCYNTGNVTSVLTTNVGELTGSGGTATNCFTSAQSFSAADLGASFQPDTNNINGGYPLLYWQSTEKDTATYTVTFSVTPSDAAVTVYNDSAHTDRVTAEEDGTYSLTMGQYFYTVSKTGYATEIGSFSVTFMDKTVTVGLSASAAMTFNVTPTTAVFTLEDTSGQTVTPTSSSDGSYVYSLYAGDSYSYTATADGYNSTTREFVAVAGTVTVTLTQSSYDSDASENQYIYGSDNSGKTSEITSGGTYYMADGATGIITISTTSPVTLVGTGTASSSMYEDLYIYCSVAGVDLTIQDVYISNTIGKTNMINYQGEGNYLRFSGTSILDQNTGASGYAMIHVNSSTGLTVGGVTDSDTLYFYKREQGAGIGGNGGASGSEGQAPEYNGDITITGGNLFMKNSKQGALIGAGASASSNTYTPGDIIIEGGVLNLVAISRGACIGGSAGSSGGSTGADVYIGPNASVNINIDYSGAAIGGGGFDASENLSGGIANDANGGTLHYSGGSIRTFIDTNAIGAWNVSTAGVHRNMAITASIENASGTPLYFCAFDTSSLSGSSFTVKDGSTTIYAGGLHEYSYINESLQKDAQLGINYTIDNWAPLDDPNLYLYLTGEDHTLTVNGQTFTATWDATSKTFTVKDVQGNPVSGGGAPTVTDDITVTATNVPATTQTGADGSVTANAAPSQSAVNKAVADAVKAADDADTKAGVELKATGDEEADETTLTIPTQSVKDMAGNSKVAELTVTASSGSVTFDETALNSLASQASGSSIVVDVKSATEEHAKEAIAAANGLSENDVDLANSIVVDVTVSSNGKPITDYSGKLTVGVPVDGEKFAEGDSYKVVVIHSDKSVETLTGKCVKVDGKLVVQVTVKKLSTFIVSGDKAVSFTDVALDAWYYDAVAYCADKGLMDGIGNNLFNPNGTLTRAMMVTVLYRLAGEPAVAEAATFTEVPTGQWYSDAIAWAEDNKLVDGYGNGVFGPNDSITREQMATILLRYSEFKGYDVTKSNDLAAYTDAAEISSWALSSMKWANAEGLVTGRTDTTLVPGGTANRAEVATILMRFCETIVK